MRYTSEQRAAADEAKLIRKKRDKLRLESDRLLERLSKAPDGTPLIPATGPLRESVERICSKLNQEANALEHRATEILKTAGMTR